MSRIGGGYEVEEHNKDDSPLAVRWFDPANGSTVRRVCLMKWLSPVIEQEEAGAAVAWLVRAMHGYDLHPAAKAARAGAEILCGWALVPSGSRTTRKACFCGFPLHNCSSNEPDHFGARGRCKNKGVP